MSGQGGFLKRLGWGSKPDPKPCRDQKPYRDPIDVYIQGFRTSLGGVRQGWDKIRSGLIQSGIGDNKEFHRLDWPDKVSSEGVQPYLAHETLPETPGGHSFYERMTMQGMSQAHLDAIHELTTSLQDLDLYAAGIRQELDNIMTQLDIGGGGWTDKAAGPAARAVAPGLLKLREWIPQPIPNEMIDHLGHVESWKQWLEEEEVRAQVNLKSVIRLVSLWRAENPCANTGLDGGGRPSRKKAKRKKTKRKKTKRKKAKRKKRQTRRNKLYY